MPLKIVLIDDDEVDRLAVCRALKTAGMAAEVSEHANPDTARAWLAVEPADAILLDYHLPRTDGLQVLKAIRASASAPPVIMLTGQGDGELAVELMKAGAADYLSKQTLTPDRLERSIRHALALARSERERLALFESERAARAEAEAANRAKDEFLATVSHELRTPLNTILGWSSLLTAGHLDAAAAGRAAAIIERNALMQARLIEDLLDISRAVSGKLQLELSAARLSAIMEPLVDSLEPAAAAKQISLTFQRSKTRPEPAVMCDQGRVQQIVGNLVSNALKFTEAGGSVTVGLAYEPGVAKVTVTDTGIGIDPAFLPVMFERFRQGDQGTTRRHGGLGLGLAIVQHLVMLHGGTVGAASDGPGRGATFTVELPVRAGKSQIREGVTVTGASLVGVRVLVVDDDEDNRELLRMILESAGADAIPASSVRGALEELDRERPDVILTDISMPGQDGYALASALAQRPGAPPAAAVTAHASAADRARLLTAGFQAHLPKPVDASAVIAVVAFLSGRSSNAPPPVLSHERRGT